MQKRELLLSLLVFGFTACATKPKENCNPNSSTPSAVTEVVVGVPIRSVDACMVEHDVEKRGFVSVPLDYADPASPQIKIFYRFIPSEKESAPTIMVFNGGPGYPSKNIRALDFDYSNPAANADKKDRLGLYIKDYNVVLVDQRGVITGNSAPLDKGNPTIDLVKLGAYFNADVLAMDHNKVLEHLVKTDVVDPSKKLYFLFHSFGQDIGWAYIKLASQGKMQNLPDGMVLSGGGFPPIRRPFNVWIGGRKNVEKYNQAVEAYSRKNKLKPFSQLTMEVRKKLRKMKVDPALVDLHYTEMMNLNQEAKVYKAVEDMLKLEEKDIAAYIDENSDANNKLNHVISVQSLYDGKLAQNLKVRAQKTFPLQPWMIDPQAAFAFEETYSPNLGSLLATKKVVAPEMPTTAETVKFLNQVPTVFHYPTTDITGSSSEALMSLENHIGPHLAKKVFIQTPGAHRVIFTESEAVEIFKNFGKTQIGKTKEKSPGA